MHWYEFPGDPHRSDLREFLEAMWAFLGLPPLTRAQRNAAYFMQHGFAGYMEKGGRVLKLYDPEGQEIWDAPEGWTPLADPTDQSRNDICMAFRGIGKSFAAAGMSLWKLYRNPFSEKILVVSASGPKAKEFVAMAHSVLISWDLLADLKPRTDQRDTINAFDVNGASVSQSHSLKAVGATGQITGSRATTVVADDIEIKDNSRTVEARALLLNTVNEFESIRLPDVPTQVLVLGTPQSEESIYRTMIREKGYKCWCWPARMPKADKRENYLYELENKQKYDVLAPELRAIYRPELQDIPTDPQRFDDEDLKKRERKTSRSYFALQFMLDTTLADAEKYPLKAFDLIVANVNSRKAPVVVQWGVDPTGKNKRGDLPNYGFTGDFCVGPIYADPEWREYTGSILYVDPAGRGSDETGWTVLKDLNGMLWCPRINGLASDTNKAMLQIAMDAKLHNVSAIIIEPNFAAGVWIAAFQPVLASVWPNGCTVYEGTWAKGQKEERIIDTLEPVVNAHRLVLDESVLNDEVFMYQYTHITRERNCLDLYDRLDSLAGAVDHFTRTLMQDVNQAAKAQHEAETEQMIEEFCESVSEAPQQFRRKARRRGHPDFKGEAYGPY